MRRIGDYESEMNPLAISDSDIERILRGQAPQGPGLSRLVSVIDELRAHGDARLRPEVIARHVSVTAAAAREALPSKTAPPLATRAPRWRLLPRLGTALATLALFLGMTGVSVAADATAPGDLLHGIDLALERIGVGAGGAAERIAEARQLAIGGMPVEALDHVSSGLGSEDSQASTALKDAAERLRVEEDGIDVVEADADVAAILEWMSTTDLEGKEFGQSVAERAQGLGQGGPGELGAAGEQSNPGKGASDKGGGGGPGGNGRGR
jgi:hypothetical protein